MAQTAAHVSLFDRFFRVSNSKHPDAAPVAEPAAAAPRRVEVHPQILIPPHSPAKVLTNPHSPNQQYMISQSPVHSPVVGPRKELTERIRKLVSVNTLQDNRDTRTNAKLRQKLVRERNNANPRGKENVVGVRRGTTGMVNAVPATAAVMWAPRAVSAVEQTPSINKIHAMSDTDTLKLTKPDSPDRVERLKERARNHPNKNPSETVATTAAKAQSKPLPRHHNTATEDSQYDAKLLDDPERKPSTTSAGHLSALHSITEADEQVAKKRKLVHEMFGEDERHIHAVVKHSIRMQRSVSKVLPDKTKMLWPIPDDPTTTDANIRDLYSMRHILGEGAFAKVHLAVHRLTAMNVAIKVFEKSQIATETQRKRVDIEIRNHSRLVHPNIAIMYEVMESPRRIYMIMEFAPHGDLHRFVSKRRRLDNKTAQAIFCDVVKALHYMHEDQCMAHRDIKLENCLLSYDRRVQLVDLGFSTDAGNPLKVACGSPSYTAPEIVARQPYNGKKVDMWSLGVLLYAMLCGYFPFQGQNNTELGMKIRSGVFRIPGHVAPDASDLIRKLLVVHEDTRYTVSQVVAHPWVNTVDPAGLALVLEKPRHTHAGVEPQEYPVDHVTLDVMTAVGFNEEYMRGAIKRNSHNHVTAAYHLLCLKREVKKSNRDLDKTKRAVGIRAAGQRQFNARSPAQTPTQRPIVPRATGPPSPGLAPT